MPTKERFEQWYAETGGDPWGYDQPFVTERLDNSLQFIRTFVPSNFSGVFLEIGAFNGSFSTKLARSYPASIIVANDISEIAIGKIQEGTKEHSNVICLLADMSQFTTPPHLLGTPTVLTLMETLYYLPKIEQTPALHRLVRENPNAKLVFISGPLRGDDYFDEEALITMFGNCDFELIGLKTLNSTDLGLGYWWQRFKAAKYLVAKILDTNERWRKKYAHQVIYCFRRL